MNVILDKSDLQALVFGSSPSYEVMSNPTKMEFIGNFGSYIGGFVDKWNWNYTAVTNADEETLWEIYQICKRDQLN